MPRLSKNERALFEENLPIFKKLLEDLYYLHKEEYKDQESITDAELKKLEDKFFQQIIFMHQNNFWWNIVNQLNSENNQFLETILLRYFFILECIFSAIDLPNSKELEKILQIKINENQNNPQIVLLKYVIDNLRNNNEIFNLEELLEKIRVNQAVLLPKTTTISYYLKKYDIKEVDVPIEIKSQRNFEIIIEQLNNAYNEFSTNNDSEEIFYSNLIIYLENNMKQLAKNYSELLNLEPIIDEYVKKLRTHYLEELRGLKREKIKLLTELQAKDNVIKESKYISNSFFDVLDNFYKLAEKSENFETTITDFINIENKKLLLHIFKQIPNGKENNREIINEREKMIKIIEDDLNKQYLQSSSCNNTYITHDSNDFRKKIQEAFIIFQKTYPSFSENQKFKNVITNIDTVLNSLPKNYADEQRPITHMYSIMNNNTIPNQIYNNHANKKYNCQEELCCRIL